MVKLVTATEDIDLLKEMLAAAEMLHTLPFAIDLWKVQNLYYEILKSNYPEFQIKAQQGDNIAEEWVNQFVLLGQQLSMRVD